MKYCYDQPASGDNDHVCFTKEELEEIKDEHIRYDNLTFEEFLEEWKIINWGYEKS